MITTRVLIFITPTMGGGELTRLDLTMKALIHSRQYRQQITLSGGKVDVY